MLLEPNLPAVVRTTTVPRQGIALPQFINPFTTANYQQNKDVQPSGAVMQPLYKKGGKIEKGQTGFKPQGDFDPELQKYLDNQQDFLNKQGDYSKYFNPDGTRKALETIEAIPTVNNTKLLAKAPTIATSNQPTTIDNQIAQRMENNIVEQKDNLQGTFSAKK